LETVPKSNQGIVESDP